MEEQPKELQVIAWLRKEADAGKQTGHRLCVRSQGACPGEWSCSTDDIIGKTDDEIRTWMTEHSIKPELINSLHDLFWFRAPVREAH